MLRRPPTRIAISTQNVEDAISERKAALEARGKNKSVPAEAGTHAPPSNADVPSSSPEVASAVPSSRAGADLGAPSTHPADIRARERALLSATQRLGIVHSTSASGGTSHQPPAPTH